MLLHVQLILSLKTDLLGKQSHRQKEEGGLGTGTRELVTGTFHVGLSKGPQVDSGPGLSEAWAWLLASGLGLTVYVALLFHSGGRRSLRMGQDCKQEGGRR